MIKRRFSYLERWEMISHGNRDYHLVDVVVFNIQKIFFRFLAMRKMFNENTSLTSNNLYCVQGFSISYIILGLFKSHLPQNNKYHIQFFCYLYSANFF